MTKGNLFPFSTLLFSANLSFVQYAIPGQALITNSGSGEWVTFANPHSNSSQTTFSGPFVRTVDGSYEKTG